MKPRILSTARLSFPLASAIAALLAAPVASAATIYWDGTSATWNTNTNWSTASGATTPDPAAVPGALDDAIFNITTVNGAETVTLDAAQAARSLTFNNTDTTTLTGGGTARTLTLGVGGMTMAATAGAVTLGDGTAGNDVLISLAAGAQTWTNNSAANFTINNTATTFSRATGATLRFNQLGAGNFAVTSGVSNDATGIVGPWALFGTGTSTRYAFNNAGTIAAYTGGTAAADANAFTTATTNYDFSNTGTTTLTGSRTANTVRYTGTDNTIDLGAAGANTLTLNGILAVGASGTLTIQRTGGTGTVVIGSSNELVIAGSQAVTISAPISGASRTVTYSGTSTLTLSAANTFTGGLNVNSGTVIAPLTASASTATSINISAGAALQLTGDFFNATTLNAPITINGSVTKFNNGGLTLNSGATLSGSGSFTTGGQVTITLNANNAAYTGTFTENSSAGGGLILGNNGALGSGIFVFSGNNAVSSTVTNFSNPNTTALTFAIDRTFSGSNNMNLGAGPVTLSGNRILTVTGVTLTLGGAVGETGGSRTLTKAGTGTLVLGGANTYSGATSVTVGTLTLSGSASNTAGALTTVTGSTLSLNKSGSAQAITGALTIGAADNNAATAQYTGASSDMMGTGLVTINGRGILDFNGKTDTIGNIAIVSTGATGSNPTPIINTAGTGNLTIGTLAITPVAGLTSVINTGTGTLTLGGNLTFTAATTGKAQISGNLDLGAATRTFTVGLGTGAGPDLLINAVISGSGVGLTKTGTGRLTLSGTNSYTGLTTVTDGILTMTTPTSLGNGGLTVAASKSFAYAPTVAGALDLGSGAITLATGSSIGAGLGGTASQSAITSTGTAALVGTGTVNIHGIPGVAPTAGSNDIITATSGLDGGTYTLGTVFNNTGFTVSGFTRAPGAISVTVTLGSAIDGNMSWKGGLAGSPGVWSASNGTTTSNWQVTDTVDQPLAPSATADLIFSTATLPGTMVGMSLGANMTVRTLTINNTATAFGLSDVSSTLAITPSASTVGITIGTGVLASSISVPVVLGASQTWTNNSVNALTVSGLISGTANLTKAGTGPLILTGPNTYVGNTTLSAGILNAGAAESANVSGPLGRQAANAAGTIILSGGTLQHSASNTNDYSGRFSTAASQAYNVDTNSQNVTWGTALTSSGGTLTKSGAGILTLNAVNTFTGGITINAGTLQIGNNAGTATLGSGNYAGNILNNGTLDFQTGANQTLSGVISGSGAIVHRNIGTLTLSGANTYTGKTTINAITNTTSPTLVVSSFNSVNGGAPLLASSSLGRPTTVPNGTIEMGSNNSTPNPTLRYTGPGETTDRVINFFFNTGAIRTLDASGTGLLRFTSVFTQNGAATGGVTLTGTGTGEIAGGLPVLGSGAFTKSGTGTWTLSGSNAYVNPTTVSDGTLAIASPGSLANTAISVTTTGILAVRPGSGTVNLGTTVAGALGATLSLGTRIFTMVDGTAGGTTNLQQNVSFVGSGLTLAGSTLNFELSGASADKLAVTKAATVSGTNLINITALGALTAGGPYNLITAPSGLAGIYNFGGSGTTTQTVAFGGNSYLLTLANSATAVTVTVGAATPIGSLTWTGRTNGLTVSSTSWDNGGSTNWASGSTAIAYGNGHDVIFGDTNAVGGTAPTGAVVIAAGGVIPTSTTFNNTTTLAYALTGGGIGGTGTLTKNNNGSVTLSGTNTYSGVTTINAGTLQFATQGSLYNNNTVPGAGTGWTAANIVVAGTLALNVGGTNQFTTGNVTTLLTNLGGTNGTTTTGFAAGSRIAFDTTNASPTTFTVADIIADSTGSGGGTIGVTKLGTNTLALSGLNSYTGNTTLSAGTLNVTNAASTTTGVFIIGAGTTLNLASFSDYGAPSAMGSRLSGSETNSATDSATTGIGLHFTGGTLQYTGSGIQSTNRQIRILNGATGGTIDASGATSADTLGFTYSGANTNLFDTSGTRTLTLTGTNQGTNTFAILLENQIANATSLTKTGTGTWRLTNPASSYTGVTTVSGGVLEVSALANGGSISNIGAATNSGNNLIFLAGLNTLRYVGSANAVTDRAFRNSNGGGGGAIIESSGAGTLSFNTTAAPIVNFTPSEARTLVLGGINTGANSFGKIIANNGSGLASLTKSGIGNWILAANNTYTGTTTVNAGTLNLGIAQSGSGGPLGGTGTVATVGVITFGGGALQFSAANTTDYSSRFSEASSNAYRLDTNGQSVNWGTARAPSGTGTLTKLGLGTLNITTASNAWTGATTISGGTLNVNTLAAVNTNSSIGKGSSGGSAADLVFDGGTMQYNGAAAQTTDRLFTVSANGGSIDASGSNNANPLTFTGTGTLLASGTGNRTLTLLGSNTGANSIAGILADPSSGSTSLTKSGAGTWTLSGGNSYGGTTTVSAGTLTLGANNVLPNGSAVSIAAATLDAVTFTDTVGTLDVTNAAAVINLGSGGTLAFADSSAVSWTDVVGNLNITGTFVPGASIRFGTTSSGLTSGQLAVISVNGSGAGTYSLDASGYLVAGGAIDHFAISTISSPQTVGTPITGITLTAQDASNATVTGFTGTVTFSGTAGITGTSGSFTAGVLTGVSVTPSVIGASRTFIVTDSVSGKFGTATFTVQSLYDAWATANGATGGPGGNTDGDTLTNLQEFAFGTDPTVSTGGSIVWVTNGAVTTTGSPVAHDFTPGGPGVDYRAVYGRRKDYVAAGLTYTVQFSADMILWQSAPVSPAPVVQTGAGGLNPSEIEAVSVLYPSLFVPLNAGGFGKATLLRVEVSVSP